MHLLFQLKDPSELCVSLVMKENMDPDQYGDRKWSSPVYAPIEMLNDWNTETDSVHYCWFNSHWLSKGIWL